MQDEVRMTSEAQDYGPATVALAVGVLAGWLGFEVKPVGWPGLEGFNFLLVVFEPPTVLVLRSLDGVSELGVS